MPTLLGSLVGITKDYYSQSLNRFMSKTCQTFVYKMNVTIFKSIELMFSIVTKFKLNWVTKLSGTKYSNSNPNKYLLSLRTNL